MAPVYEGAHMIEEITELIERGKTESGKDEFRVSIVFLPYGSDSLIDKSKALFKKAILYRDPPKRTLFAGFERKDRLDGNETYSFMKDGITYTFTERKMRRIHDCFDGLPFVCKNRFQFVSFRVKGGSVVEGSVRWIKGRLNVYTTYSLILELENDRFNDEENEKLFLRSFPSMPALDCVLSFPLYCMFKIETIHFSHYRWKKTKLCE